MTSERPRTVTVLHRMTDEELAESLRTLGRYTLARRLTGLELGGCLISFMHENTYHELQSSTDDEEP